MPHLQRRREKRRANTKEVQNAKGDPAHYHGAIRHIGRPEKSSAKNLAEKNATSEGGFKISPKSYRHNAKGGSLISVAIVRWIASGHVALRVSSLMWLANVIVFRNFI